MNEAADTKDIDKQAGQVWQVGLAEVDITPEEPIRMGGYGARTTPRQGVHDRLRAKALAMQDDHCAPAVIVTCDLIGIDAPYAEIVTAAITARTGVPRERLILNASHTHGSPVFGIRYPEIWELDEAEAAVITRYSDRLRELLVQVVTDALADMQPARLSQGHGTTSFAMNRRGHTVNGVQGGVNPRGYADRTVSVLSIEGADGVLRGVLFCYACHNTTLGGNNLLITADYAGYAQRFIERELDVPGLFMQGCGATSNPHPRGTYEWACTHGEALGQEVCRIMTEAEFTPVLPPLAIAFDHVDMPLEPPPPRQELDRMLAGGGYYAAVAQRIQARIDSGKPWATHYPTPIAVWRFGQGLTLVRLSGEVVGEYIPLLEQALGPLDLWVAGYCADYFGYLPSAKVHREGGYEGRDFISGFGYLAVDVERAVLAKARELAERIGRKVPPLNW